MQKGFFSFILSVFILTVNAQSYFEGFESPGLPAGWDTLNLSGPATGSAPCWFGSASYSGPPAAKEGNDFFSANYKAVGNTGTISSWLFTPVTTLKNGNIFMFYTRTLSSPVQYPDRLEIRMSANGSSINAGSTPTSVGDFSMTLAVINPSLNATAYPTNWTKYALTLNGLPAGGASGRVAFRYFVTNGGPNGINSDAIGIDSVFYLSNISTGLSNIDRSGFRLFPNPASGFVKVLFENPYNDREILIQNVLGEVICNHSATLTENTIDLSALSRGTYFILVKDKNGVHTEKLILN